MLEPGKRQSAKNLQEIDCDRRDAAELFALSQGYGRRLGWDPFLRSAKLLGGATEAGLGVRAYCIANAGQLPLPPLAPSRLAVPAAYTDHGVVSCQRHTQTPTCIEGSG